MSKGISTFAKGLAAGMAAGAIATVVGKTVMDNRHSVSKGSAKVMRAVSDFINGIQTIIK